MKYFLITIVLLFSNTALSHDPLANPIKSIYLEDVYINYAKSSNHKVQDELLIFLDKKNTSPTYKYKIISDEKLADAAVFENKIVIVLKIQMTHHILVISKITGEVLDNFWGFFAKLSPSGQFVVFKKFQYRNEQSPHGRPVGVTMIYDLGKSAKENRTLEAQKLLKRIPINLRNTSRNAGLPAYPLGDYNEPSYGYSKDRTKIVSTAGYHWYQSNAFIFATPSFNNKTSIISALYNEKTTAFSVSQYTLRGEGLKLAGMNEQPNLGILNIKRVGNQIMLRTTFSIIKLTDNP